MMSGQLISFVSLILLQVVRIAADATAVVYCEAPVVNSALAVLFCGDLKSPAIFPNSLGFAALMDGAIVVTSAWDNSYISIHTSQSTSVTSAYGVGMIAGTCAQAHVAYCQSTQKPYLATFSYYTIYAPNGDIDAALSQATATVTATVTVDATNGICPNTVTVTETTTYSYGTDGVVTLYTSGSVPGVETITTCADV